MLIIPVPFSLEARYISYGNSNVWALVTVSSLPVPDGMKVVVRNRKLMLF